MNILMIGGTRFFGVYTVEALLRKGHQVTLATRGKTRDSFGARVTRIVFDRTDPASVKKAFAGKKYDAVIDKLAYSSKDVRCLLEVLKCDQYIQMSSTAVYESWHDQMREEEFDGREGQLIWCDRKDAPYDEVKRQAERAIYQNYPGYRAVSVRYPYVIGRDDYTKRLLFYVEHVMKQIPMQVDHINDQMSFIRSDEAGEFMAYLVGQSIEGPINGASAGTISTGEILQYLEQKTGKKAILSQTGEPAPYNGTSRHSINTKKAESIGFVFSNLKDWLYELLDDYIEKLSFDKK